MKAISEEVKDSAYKIIEAKGETSYGIGLSLVRITRAIIHDENAVLSVSTLIDDYLGVKDIYLSLPSIVNKSGIRENLKIELSSKEQALFRHSAEKIKNVIKQIGL
jgi:L-lactate dehydrogenase